MADKRVFIQGDRNTSEVDRKTAIEIMKKLGELGWKANVGAYGALVAAICESGVPVRSHGFGAKDRPEQIDHSQFEFVDCESALDKLSLLVFKNGEASRRLLPQTSQPYAWAIRLAVLMETSDAFIFFPGRQGTLAHLVPILACNIKGKGKPKKVALVGWNHLIIGLLLMLMGIDKETVPWLGTFDLEEKEIEQAVADFLNQDLPHS